MGYTAPSFVFTACMIISFVGPPRCKANCADYFGTKAFATISESWGFDDRHLWAPFSRFLRLPRAIRLPSLFSPATAGDRFMFLAKPGQQVTGLVERSGRVMRFRASTGNEYGRFLESRSGRTLMAEFRAVLFARARRRLPLARRISLTQTPVRFSISPGASCR